MGLGAGLGSNARLSILSAGDSETAGYGSTPGGPAHNCGYRYLLQQIGQANGINMQFVGNQTLPGADANTRQIFSGGLSGDSIAGMTARLQGALNGYFPEIVCMKIGTNDVMALAVVGTMATQLDTAILNAWNLGQRPGVNRTKLVIVAQIPDTFTGANVAAMHALTIAYNALIPGIVAGHVAAGRNVKMIDLYTPMGASPGVNFNGGSVPHQSDAGYTVEAPIWFGTPGSGLICDYGR